MFEKQRGRGGHRTFHLRLSGKIFKQAQLGVRIQVELGFILQAGTRQIINLAQNTRQSQSVQGTELNWGGDTSQKKCIQGGGTPHIISEQEDNRRGHRT